jgi:hypothetical protein
LASRRRAGLSLGNADAVQDEGKHIGTLSEFVRLKATLSHSHCPFGSVARTHSLGSSVGMERSFECSGTPIGGNEIPLGRFHLEHLSVKYSLIDDLQWRLSFTFIRNRVSFVVRPVVCGSRGGGGGAALE